MGVKLVFASTPAGAFAALRKKPGIHLPFYYKQNGVRKQPLSYRLPCAYFLCDTTSFFRDMRSNRQGHQYSERVSGKSIEVIVLIKCLRASNIIRVTTYSTGNVHNNEELNHI